MPRSVLVVGGLASSLVNFRGPLLQALRDAGHEVCAAAPALSVDRVTTARLTDAGIRCCDVALERAGLNPLGDALGLWSLVRLMRRERPHAVLCYTIKPVIWGTVAAWLSATPKRYALVTGLGYAFTDGATLKRRLVRWVSTTLYRFALRRATKIFFQNPDDAALFRELGLAPPWVPVVIVNGSGVDVDHFAPSSLPQGPMRFLMIARLLGDKGVREYAGAAARVMRDYPDAEFHLVGPTDTNPDGISAEEVRAWERDGVLKWHGAADDVRPHIADCHVYVLPSYREGTPRTVLEAMAMGRPIITSDAPGCRETVVDGDNGFLIAPREVDPLVGALRRFLDEPALVGKMGASSRRLVEQKYDVRKVNATMLAEMELC